MVIGIFPQWMSRDRIMEPFRSEKTLKIIRSCVPEAYRWVSLAETSDTHLTYPLSATDASDTHTNTPDTRNVDVCENSSFIYGITRGMCLENKRVSPQTFWLQCLELQKERDDTLPQTVDLFFPGNRAWYHWVTLVKSVQGGCHLVAKGIVSRTLTSLCIK